MTKEVDEFLALGFPRLKLAAGMRRLMTPYSISQAIPIGLLTGDKNMYGDISITANKNDVLSKLRDNLAGHKKIVAEARQGYLKKAKEEIAKRMGELEKGKIVALSFGLQLPQDHSRAYTSAIAALEMHTGDTIQLSGTDVRTLILNQWDWMQSFLGTNSAYSGSAREAMSNSDSDDNE